MNPYSLAHSLAPQVVCLAHHACNYGGDLRIPSGDLHIQSRRSTAVELDHFENFTILAESSTFNAYIRWRTSLITNTSYSNREVFLREFRHEVVHSPQPDWRFPWATRSLERCGRYGRPCPTLGVRRKHLPGSSRSMVNVGRPSMPFATRFSCSWVFYVSS